MKTRAVNICTKIETESSSKPKKPGFCKNFEKLPYGRNILTFHVEFYTIIEIDMEIYPKGMIIPGRADCKAFQGKQIRSTKTGKLNRYEYNMLFNRANRKSHIMKTLCQIGRNTFSFVKKSLLTGMVFFTIGSFGSLVNASLAPNYNITPLEKPYVDSQIWAEDINDSGDIVGGYQIDGGINIDGGMNYPEPEYALGGVLWNNSQIQTVGPINGPIYNKINNRGDVVDIGNNFALSGGTAYFFDSDHQIQNLNDEGILLIDYRHSFSFGSRTRPLLFDLDNGKGLSVPGWDNDAYSFYGDSINNSNLCVGTTRYHDPPLYRYTADAPGIWDRTFRPESRFDLAPQYRSFKDINDNGLMLLYTSRGVGTAGVWSKSQGMIAEIGGVEGKIGKLIEINNLNQAIGSIGNSGIIWDEDDGMIYLNNLVLNSPGWGNLMPVDINNSGTIIGYGNYNGGYNQYFIMNPIPEPTTIGLVGLGSLALLKRKRR